MVNHLICGNKQLIVESRMFHPQYIFCGLSDIFFIMTCAGGVIAIFQFIHDRRIALRHGYNLANIVSYFFSR